MVDLGEECETAFVPSSVLGMSVEKKKQGMLLLRLLMAVEEKCSVFGFLLSAAGGRCPLGQHWLA